MRLEKVINTLSEPCTRKEPIAPGEVADVLLVWGQQGSDGSQDGKAL